MLGLIQMTVQQLYIGYLDTFSLPKARFLTSESHLYCSDFSQPLGVGGRGRHFAVLVVVKRLDVGGPQPRSVSSFCGNLVLST